MSPEVFLSLPKGIRSEKVNLREKLDQVCVWSLLVSMFESDAGCDCSSAFKASSSRMKLQTIVNYSDVKQFYYVHYLICIVVRASLLPSSSIGIIGMLFALIIVVNIEYVNALYI